MTEHIYHQNRTKRTNKKLTNEIIDERILNRPLKRIGDYINSYTKIEWECTICGHKWLAPPQNILHSRSGCFKCNNNKTLTNEIIDFRLSSRNVQRISDYINSYTKIKWKCKICNHFWEARPEQILGSKNGCPLCTNHIKLTNEIIDNRLIYNKIPISRISNFIANTKTKWKCNTCFYEWDAKADNILNAGNGCPKCKKLARYTNDSVDLQLINRNIIRLDCIISASTKIKWKCKTCNHEWYTTPINILYSATGCPKCSNIHRISGAEDEWLNYNNVPNTPKNRQVSNLIPGRKYTVDGYVSKTNTIYEYLGDYWHGNPEIYNQSDINPSNNIQYGILYNQWCEKKSNILKSGFNLVEVWDSEWKLKRKFIQHQ